MKDRLKIVITVLACFSLAMILGFVLRDAGLRGIETVYAADEGTPTPSGTATPTPTGTVTPTPSGSVTPTPTGTATPTPTGTATPTPTGTVTPTPSGTATPTPTGTVTPTPSPTPTEPPVILAILAAYTGDSAVVGTKLDTDKLVVKAFYSDGSEIDLAPTEYILSTDIVESVGSNVIVVLYKTFSTRVTVVGKKPVLITASTSRYMLSVGNSVDKKELTVYCTFSDGSREKVTDYTIENEAIKNMGANTVTVKYQGLSATVTVYGQTPKKIKILTATVDVEKIFVGAELDPLDFTVTAVYTDATTERVAGFKMNPTAFEEEGEQALTISYQDAKVEIKVKPVKRKPVSVRAEYDGTKVMVGQRMIDDHLKVYATYDDGKTDEVTDYKIYSRKIKYIGENELRVHFEDVQDTFIVEGTAYIPPSFDYVSSFDIRNGSDALTFTAAIPVTLDEDCVKGTIFKGGNLKKLIRKLKVKGSYIGFQFEFEDEDNETELPLAVRITIPDGYTMADTELYFSPNRKTILGRMTKEVKSNTVFETTVFKTGYYILVCAPVSEE